MTNFFEGAIFDMDGLLIDSEPMWTIAEKEVFGSVGITMTDEDCRQTIGWALIDVVKLRYQQKPWRDALTVEQVADRILQRVIALIADIGQPLPGVYATLDFLRGKGLKVGLASASGMELIDTILDVLKLKDGFDTVVSAAELPYSKPHPMVYLTAAERLGLNPARCLGFEDSVTGLIAVKSAGMKAIAVPAAENAADPRYAIADVRLSSLDEFDHALYAELSAPAKSLSLAIPQ